MTAHYDKAARGRYLDCSILEGRIPTCTGLIEPAITECEWKRDLVDETRRGPMRVLDRRGLLMEVMVVAGCSAMQTPPLLPKQNRDLVSRPGSGKDAGRDVGVPCLESGGEVALRCPHYAFHLLHCPGAVDLPQ